MKFIKLLDSLDIFPFSEMFILSPISLRFALAAVEPGTVVVGGGGGGTLHVVKWKTCLPGGGDLTSKTRLWQILNWGSKSLI